MKINPLHTHNKNVNQGGDKKIAGVRLPNFNYMNTQSTPQLSDDEIRARIVELGKRYAETGERNDDERNKLTRMFMSSAAPDRRGAITNALTALETQVNSLRKLSNTHTSMGEWIELLFGRALLNPNFSLNHLDVHDSNGNLIATFNESTGWREVITPNEWARSRELAGLFSDTVRAVQNGKPMVDITGEVIEPPKIDVKM
ncbi:MAG: hypothetical protein FWB96_00780 [Defluviitaleaceae bacterium]|nr:hypothetical protein [Defluviitaleaceae bacterium]MCL2262744.1 hypothetical protein [Defluviitaleaceae bacterium]